MGFLYEERRKRMVEDLKKLKKESPELSILMDKKDRNNSDPYAVISDGKNVICVQFGEYVAMGYSPAFEYVPSEKTGSGCIIFNSLKENLPVHFTKDLYDECVAKGKEFASKYNAKLWTSFSAYMNYYPGRKDMYEELTL